MFAGRARGRAAVLLDDVAAAFRPVGYRVTERRPLEARLEAASGRVPLLLRFVARGRVFGGEVALEVATADPVVPAVEGGLEGRPEGALRLRRVAFRARGGSDGARALAERLGADPALAKALAAVHFQRVRVDADGRAVIRHMGGSVVWILFPPLVRAVPLVPEQARATADALAAFAVAGGPTPARPR